MNRIRIKCFFLLDSWVKSDQVIENHLIVSGMESNHLFKNLLSHEMNPFTLFEAIFNRFRKKINH